MSELPVLGSSLQDTKPTRETEAVIEVRLIGVLASGAGTRQMFLEREKIGTVMDLVETLLARVGKKQFEDYLVDSGTHDPRPNVIILLDDQDCGLLGGLKASVREIEAVTIIPVAHGG